MRKALVTRRPNPLFAEPFFRGLERFFDDDAFLGTGFPGRGEDLQESRWIPQVDVRETDDAYLFAAELPGLKKDDVEITIEEKVLTLSGERKFEKAEDKNGYHRIERSYGTFSRSFTLPHIVDQESVKAVFEDGVLTVTIPKVEAAKPRKIEIS